MVRRRRCAASERAPRARAHAYVHLLTPDAPPRRAVNTVRPTGFFESNPGAQASLASPASRFKFRGTCQPTLFQSRVTLSDAEEALLADAFRAMEYETVMNRFVIATLMRPFDPVQRGSVTTSRFKRVIATHFKRLGADMIDLLAKSYAGPDDQVRYSALSRDVTPDTISELHGLPPPSPRAAAPPPSPNVRMERALLEPASDEELREGFRVLLRTLHERRIRIGDVLRDFSLHAPVPGRITREQFIRGLSSIGVGSVTVDPRVIEGIANMYRIESDPMWVDSTACIRDLESTTYLRHLEQMAPETKNETFGRSVALSPNPRFIKHELPADEDARLQEVLSRLGNRAKHNRVFNVRIFAAQYDKAHDVRATARESPPPRARTLTLLHSPHPPPAGLPHEGPLHARPLDAQHAAREGRRHRRAAQALPDGTRLRLQGLPRHAQFDVKERGDLQFIV